MKPTPLEKDVGLYLNLIFYIKSSCYAVCTIWSGSSADCKESPPFVLGIADAIEGSKQRYICGQT